MRQLRFRFAVFACALVAGFAALVWLAAQQLETERRALARSLAEQVFEQFETQVDALLADEDRRPFAEFRYLVPVAGAAPSATSVVRSPLADRMGDGGDGLVGYFQIDSDGSFSTPHMPVNRDLLQRLPTPDRDRRVALETRLSELTRPLQDRLRAGATEAERAPYPDDAAWRDAKVRGEDTRARPGKVRVATMDQKISKSDLLFFESQEPSLPASPANGPAPTTVRPGDGAAVSLDPFQALVTTPPYVVFFRKLWIARARYVQGFVVDARPFFAATMARAMAGSPLAADTATILAKDGQDVARFEPTAGAWSRGTVLYARRLGYPLHALTWRLEGGSLPRLGSGSALALVSGFAGLVVALGLVLVYRTAAEEVRLSRKRQDLVAAVTHELRTPLTSIRMYAEMLEGGMVDVDAKRGEYYRHIGKESARLSRLIENVLQLARLEKRTVRIGTELRAAREDFDDIARELRGLAERDGFRLEAVADAELPAIAYDPDAVRQILLALFENSLKFAASASDRSLRMTLRCEGPLTVWAWRDHGPGVPAGEERRIFETFYRVESESTRRTKGTGIGLAMARMLAEAMQARIEARSLDAADGGGLEVRLVFGQG